MNSNNVVRIIRDGKCCFYLVTDLRVEGNLLTFQIESDFYAFEFSLLAYHEVMSSGIIDCTRLKQLRL